ncbi:GSCOCG00008944001-RA-CDS [Cotesia congregata]|nr:GSCOCG00008944001-RA-CDS [Cotesia congregata]
MFFDSFRNLLSCSSQEVCYQRVRKEFCESRAKVQLHENANE